MIKHDEIEQLVGECERCGGKTYGSDDFIGCPPLCDQCEQEQYIDQSHPSRHTGSKRLEIIDRYTRLATK